MGHFSSCSALEIMTSVKNHNPGLSGVIRTAVMIKMTIITVETVAGDTYDMCQALL